MTYEVISISPAHYEYRETENGRYPFVKPNRYVRHVEHEYLGRYVEDSPVTSSGIKKGDYSPYQHFVNRHHWGSSVMSDNQKKLVHNKALSKLHGELEIASNLFEDWYERRQTYELMGSAIKEVLTFARNWRNPSYYVKLGKKAKTPSTLPEAWLMYNFGVKPLIGTIDTCLNGLAQPIPHATFSGVSAAEVLGKRKSGYDDFLDLELWYDFSYLKKIGCTAVPNPNPNYGLANIAGLTTPFSTAWAVAPWGWAIDYFVNVSEMLNNIELVHPGVKTMDYYETIIERTKWHGSIYQYEYRGTPVRKKYDYCRYSGEGYRMTRDPLSRAPSFKLTFDFPLLGSSKIANLSSALALTLKGSKK